MNTASLPAACNRPGVSDNSETARKFINELPENQKIEEAVRRLVAGYTLYFTCGHNMSESPFPLEIRNRVVTELKENGHDVEEVEVYDDGSSLYSPSMKGTLDGVRVKINNIFLAA